MSEFTASSAYFGLCLSILAYIAGLSIKKRFRSGLANPLLIGILITIAVLVIFRIDYDAYNSSAKMLTFFLTPATVCLALPLYQQLAKLKKNYKAILSGITAGTVASMSSVLILSKIFGFSHEEYITFLPKSITSAIGMDVSEELGGYASITVAAIILSGVLGHIICESLLKIAGVRNSIAKGTAIGTASHAIGTSKAFEIGEIEGAISSLSIVIAGIITVILAKLFAGFY